MSPTPNGRGGWDLTDADAQEVAEASGWTERYAVLLPIPDDADDAVVAALRGEAVSDWTRAVQRDGRVAAGEAVATLEQSAFPFYVDDPDGGEQVKLPDRAWRVVGQVRT